LFQNFHLCFGFDGFTCMLEFKEVHGPCSPIKDITSKVQKWRMNFLCTRIDYIWFIVIHHSRFSMSIYLLIMCSLTCKIGLSL
jgi:hypothetical protein